MKDVIVRNLCVTRGENNIFSDFNISFEHGKITVLLAPSGAGKTTLLDCIAGLLPVIQGNIEAPKKISYLFQEPRLLPWCNLEKNVMLPLLNIMSKQEAQERTRFFLSKTNLQEKSKSFPFQCSGGQRQRCALARAFAYPSSVLLMDEAFQSQDLPLKLKLMELTESLLLEENRTVILVTHDVREAICIADRIVVFAGKPVQIKLDVSIKNRTLSLHDCYMTPETERLEIEAALLNLLTSS
ncbi:MAG: ATP-binding cassette domain-containing protein [Spirochaetaceae bacterium]|nr:ATP-binding cassette domain-containing protein [Spirochaetaceae bacterium]